VQAVCYRIWLAYDIVCVCLLGDGLLHKAAREGLEDAALFLLTRGANVGLTNKKVFNNCYCLFQSRGQG
jgi:hypothetical protein